MDTFVNNMYTFSNFNMQYKSQASIDNKVNM